MFLKRILGAETKKRKRDIFMKYIDFHTHLDCYKNQEELKNQLASIDDEETIVSASMDASSYKKNLSLANDAKKLNLKAKIIPTLGIHPARAQAELKNLDIYRPLLEKSRIIGEIGIDFCWHKDVPCAAQEKVFRFFLEHCGREKKYCVIHTKDAEEKICRILEDYPGAKPIIHWYDGPDEIYTEFIKRGYMQTFGCETSRSSHIQSMLKRTPRNLILAETDNPDSEPWLGGKDNSVFLIKRIYSDIAKVLGIEEKAAAKIINQNSERILCYSKLLK